MAILWPPDTPSELLYSNSIVDRMAVPCSVCAAFYGFTRRVFPLWFSLSVSLRLRVGLGSFWYRGRDRKSANQGAALDFLSRLQKTCATARFVCARMCVGGMSFGSWSLFFFFFFLLNRNRLHRVARVDKLRNVRSHRNIWSLSYIAPYFIYWFF